MKSFWFAIVVGALGLGSFSAQEPEPPSQWVYAAQLAAAESGELHLVLDPAAERIGLCVENVILKSFPILKGRVKGSVEGAFEEVGFKLATELPEPDRPDLAARSEEGPSAAARAVLIAAWRQEMLDQSPTEYLLEFQPALTLQVHPEQSSTWDGEAKWWGRRAAESWKAMVNTILGRNEPLVVEIVLETDSARRLYQALIPEMTLVIAPDGLRSYR